jgi:hypothetical protein
VNIPVSELRKGQRVTLFCPNARVKPRRDAVFEGVMTRDEVIAATRQTRGQLLGGAPALKAQRYAIFLTETVAPLISPLAPYGTGAHVVQLRHVMEVTDAGRLKDDEGRAVYIEAGAAMGIG